MKNDTQITHHLWWIYQFLDTQFKNKEYKDIINEPIDEDTFKELNKLIQHIKLNY